MRGEVEHYLFVLCLRLFLYRRRLPPRPVPVHTSAVRVEVDTGRPRPQSLHRVLILTVLDPALSLLGEVPTDFLKVDQPVRQLSVAQSCCPCANVHASP